MNQLSFNTFNESPWLGGSGHLGAWVEDTASAGFALLGPDCPSIEAWLAAGNGLKALARQMKDAGIGCEVVSVCALLDGSAEQLAALRRAANHADALGVKILQVNVNAPDVQTRLNCVADAARHIEGRGLKLAIEYLPMLPLNTLAETLEIAGVVGADKVGALVDIWHHSRDPRGWQSLVTAPLESIAYLEFCDAQPMLPRADLNEETLQRRTFPGEGVLDCARFADAWRDRGYTGFVSVEVLNRAWRGRPVGDFARACHEASAPYWA